MSRILLRWTVAGAGCLLLCAAALDPALAQSNISVSYIDGTFDDGATVTIHGIGFGQKQPAAPVLWDDFEGHAIGSHVSAPEIGSYSRVSANLVYSNTGVFSGSSSAYEPIPDSYWFNGVVSNWFPKTAKRSYASFVVKLNSASGSLSVPDDKILRLNTASPDATHGYPGASLGEAGEGAFIWFLSNIGGPNQVYLNDTVTREEFNDPNNKWFSLGLWTVMSDPDVANGFVGREFNGNIREQHNVETLDGSFSFDGTRSAYFSGHVNSEGSGALEQWLDEVYADTTLARVFVRDVTHSGESGSSGGQVAMQLPQSWTDTAITVKVNTGRYATGTQLALTVYNADGFYSAPVTVTVGEAGGGGGGGGDEDQGPPGPPLDVLISQE